MEIFIEVTIVISDDEKALVLWKLPIKERFDFLTANHDCKYYSKINKKDIK